MRADARANNAARQRQLRGELRRQAELPSFFVFFLCFFVLFCFCCLDAIDVCSRHIIAVCVRHKRRSSGRRRQSREAFRLASSVDARVCNRDDECRCAAEIESKYARARFQIRARTVDGAEASSKCQLDVTTTAARMAPPQQPQQPQSQQMAHEPPSFAPSLINQIVQENAAACVQVRIFGNPTPSIKWQLDDAPLRESENVRIVNDADGWSRVFIKSLVAAAISLIYHMTKFLSSIKKSARYPKF